MIHKFSRYLLTLVALLAMTTGAWAGETATITLKCGQTVKTYENVTLPWSTTAEILKEVVTDLNFNVNINAISGGDGKVVKYGNENFTVTGTFSGNATVTVTYNTGSSATITVTAPAPLITLNEAETVATMAAMPAYDATVEYELVRDMAVGFNFMVGDGQDGFTTRVKKDGEGYVPSEMTMEEMMALVTATDVLDAQNPVTLVNNTDYTLQMFAADADGKPTGEAVAFNQLVPGTAYVAVATGIGDYDGTAVSNTFQMVEAYDLTLSPATDAHLKSVTVDGTAKTADANGVIKNIEPGKKVKITTTGPDYIIRKAEVKKTGPAVLAPALENGATVVIICNWGYNKTTFTYTNNGGTFSGQASGYDADYLHNGLELNGKNLSFGAWDEDGSEFVSVGITFNTESSAYSYTGKGEDFVSFTISVNGTDVTDQLSELK